MRLACAIAVLSCVLSASACAEELSEARELLLTGKYDEAAESYAALSEKHPVEAAIGIAQAKQSTGKRDEAERLLHAAFAKHPKEPQLAAELGLSAFTRGDLAEAQKQADAALVLDKNSLAARWLVAELHVSAGRMKEAAKAYEWFIDYQNAHDPKTPEDVYWIGRGAAQYARWKRNSGQFKVLVNDLYPQAIELEKNFWPAHLEIALLFAEKYNESAAASGLNAALAINPNSAELHVARAALAMQKYDLPSAQKAIDRALAINPEAAAAYQLRADVLLAEGQTKEALSSLEKAKALNSVDEETLGRIAATFYVLDGWHPDDKDSRASKLIAEVVARNEHCGRFYSAIGDTFDLMRKYPQAAIFYAQTQTRMPELITTKARLGMVKMRLGEEEEASKLLTVSFRDDPFNVRVKNTLEVLDVLAGYAVLETEHFVIKFDRGQDELLAKYAAKYLEEQVYPEIVKTLGYEPQGKSLFEIFGRAKNTRGHSWFSARMVGMPFIGTVGACAGKIVALASPGDMPQKFHWGRVLKHEFVHVVNLQQTDFNIPHWYTEGLAVRLESLPSPTSWDIVLAEYAAKDKLFNLDTINLGFIRPANSTEWSLAYCQAELYCDYLVATYGDGALAKLIKAYHDNLSTPDALQREFGVDVISFEKGYRQFVDKRLEKHRAASTAAESKSLDEWQEAVKKSPDDATLQGQLALAYLDAQDIPNARRAATAAQTLDAKQPLAGYVLARVQLSIGDNEAALATLRTVHNADKPQELVLSLLAQMQFQANDFAGAETLYKLGEQHFSPREKWLKALAKVYLKSGENDKLAGVLAGLAELDYDNLTLRKKLAQLAAAKKDWPVVERWALDGLFIDIQDATLHAQVAEARVNLQQYAAASEEYRVAIELDPDVPAWRFALADALVEGGEKDEARRVLQKLIEVAPKFPGAELMLEQLNK